MNKKTLFITQAAIIAALYAALTVGQNLLLPDTASAAVQFRVAEALCFLVFFTPAAIPGITVGCVIANISSVMAGYGFYDMIFGSAASLLALLAMYYLGKLKTGKSDGLTVIILCVATLMPVIFNGIIVGAELMIFVYNEIKLEVFLLNAGCVALGEIVVCFVLGLPLYFTIEKSKLKNLIALEGK